VRGERRGETVRETSKGKRRGGRWQESNQVIRFDEGGVDVGLLLQSKRSRASQKVGAHQAKTFLAVVVEDDCKSFQKYHPWPRPQLCKESIKNVDMDFWVDFLIYGLIERNDIVSYCQCGQH
jgi:hypothetical protein